MVLFFNVLMTQTQPGFYIMDGDQMGLARGNQKDWCLGQCSTLLYAYGVPDL